MVRCDVERCDMERCDMERCDMVMIDPATWAATLVEPARCGWGDVVAEITSSGGRRAGGGQLLLAPGGVGARLTGRDRALQHSRGVSRGRRGLRLGRPGRRRDRSAGERLAS